ncbi:MAG TPA: hypothetical protein VNX28_16200, partial [Gemmataceae bacterium]|nr:hypothetical protein [Gemmataceae bacterium]
MTSLPQTDGASFPAVRIFEPAPPAHAHAAAQAHKPAPRKELNTRELVAAYLAHSEKRGLHGFDALAERFQTLSGIILHLDRKTGERTQKPSKFPGFIDVILPDGRKIGDCMPSELKPHVLEDWIENNPRWTSSSTRKAKANQVNAVMNWAWNGKRIADNPFRGITYEEAEKRPPLTDDFLEEVTGVANKAFDELASYLRLVSRRLGEVCNMDWEHVDWKRQVVRVVKFKGRRHVRKDQFYALCPEA